MRLYRDLTRFGTNRYDSSWRTMIHRLVVSGVNADGHSVAYRGECIEALRSGERVVYRDECVEPMQTNECGDTADDDSAAYRGERVEFVSAA